MYLFLDELVKSEREISVHWMTYRYAHVHHMSIARSLNHMTYHIGRPGMACQEVVCQTGYQDAPDYPDTEPAQNNRSLLP